MNGAAAPPWAKARQTLQAAWTARDARERRLLLLAAWVVGLFLLWTLALRPALRTLREAPARLDGLEAQLQAMQAQAADVRSLRATPPLPRAQAVAALKAASDRLGERARLQEQGDRAVLTISGATGQQLQAWLAEVRSTARARAVDINLTRGEQGLSGAVIVTLPGG
ncbi:MAG: type II secretion system protein GspM [Rubrivivax sp.]